MPKPTCELHIDAGVLAEMFGLDGVGYEHVAVRNTLSGRPYIAIRVPAPTGVKDGSVVYGTVERHLNGSVTLGVKPS